MLYKIWTQHARVCVCEAVCSVICACVCVCGLWCGGVCICMRKMWGVVGVVGVCGLWCQGCVVCVCVCVCVKRVWSVCVCVCVCEEVVRCSGCVWSLMWGCVWCVCGGCVCVWKRLLTHMHALLPKECWGFCHLSSRHPDPESRPSLSWALTASAVIYPVSVPSFSLSHNVFFTQPPTWSLVT